MLALNWGDVDFATGAVIVRQGKAGKARVEAIGATPRRALELASDGMAPWRAGPFSLPPSLPHASWEAFLPPATSPQAARIAARNFSRASALDLSGV